MPCKTLANFFANIDSSISLEKRICCFFKSETNLVAYLGSFAALINRSVAPHRAETTITALPFCASIIEEIRLKSEESLRHDPPNL